MKLKKQQQLVPQERDQPAKKGNYEHKRNYD